MDSENPRDNNWRHLWERRSKNSHRQRARLHRLSRDPSLPSELVVPTHSSSSQDLVVMASNPANQSLEDQFLRWHQDMVAKQEEQARHMAELQSRADHLQEENDRMRARMEGEQIENARGSSHPTPSNEQNKGKELIRPDDRNTVADDELFFDSSPLLDVPPPKNNVEAESRKKPPPRSSRSVSGLPRRVRKEFSRERR